jgi:drug/metabolite transporter (DMT)-like permease
MSSAARRLRLKTRLVVAVTVLAGVFGNFFMSLGLKSRATLLSLSPWPYLEAFLNPWVALGVGLLILWTLARMTLLSWADLSYVLPVTAIGYVLTALLGRFLLLEEVSWQRWAGIALIVGGIALVRLTPIRTTLGPHPRRVEP